MRLFALARLCLRVLPLPLLILAMAGCGSTSDYDPRLEFANLSIYLPDPLAQYTVTGDVTPVRDPAMIHVGNTYYLFSTDEGSSLDGNHLPIRCSTDASSWKLCGYVFSDRPQWVKNEYAGIADMWAPDISFFNGVYHLYYAVSIFGTAQSGIGFATNSTLDPSDPSYQWVDQGEILSSRGDTSGLNAIDPNIFIDDDGKIWLNYGSFGSGLFQQEVDPGTGHLVQGGTVYHLAERPSAGPIEGTSIIHHGNYYYIFVSLGLCCTPNPADSTYMEGMGRSTSVHGPFVTMNGDPMLQGYSTVFLYKNLNWMSAGGGTAYNDPTSGETMIAFHAYNKQANYAPQLWVKHFTWINDWPLLKD